MGARPDLLKYFAAAFLAASCLTPAVLPDRALSQIAPTDGATEDAPAAGSTAADGSKAGEPRTEAAPEVGPEAGATATPSPDPAPGADPDVLDGLFEDLRTAEPAEVDAIEGQIWTEWSKSGSAAMDLLLDRGREAMDNLDTVAAIDHFSALIDHAPGFAEAYNARATAFYVDGRYGESLEDLRVALSLNPRHFGAITGLAIIFEDLERPEEALEAWYKVRELSPGQPAAHDAITRLELQVLGSEI